MNLACDLIVTKHIVNADGVRLDRPRILSKARPFEGGERLQVRIEAMTEHLMLMAVPTL